MTQRRYLDTVEDAGGRDGAPTSRPLWVKVAGIIGITLVLLLGYMLLFGGGQHGPGQHAPSRNDPGPTAPPSIIDGEDGGAHTPPPGGHG